MRAVPLPHHFGKAFNISCRCVLELALLEYDQLLHQLWISCALRRLDLLQVLYAWHTVCCRGCRFPLLGGSGGGVRR